MSKGSWYNRLLWLFMTWFQSLEAVKRNLNRKDSIRQATSFTRQNSISSMCSTIVDKQLSSAQITRHGGSWLIIAKENASMLEANGLVDKLIHLLTGNLKTQFATDIITIISSCARNYKPAESLSVPPCIFWRRWSTIFLTNNKLLNCCFITMSSSPPRSWDLCKKTS